MSRIFAGKIASSFGRRDRCCKSIRTWLLQLSGLTTPPFFDCFSDLKLFISGLPDLETDEEQDKR